MKRVLALMLLLGTSAAADVVRLTDGTRLEGQIVRSGSVYIFTAADGSTRQIDPADLQSVQGTGTPVSPEAELASLRRQLISVTQPGLAAGRLRDFISRHPGTPAAADAQKDLAIWQHRADAGLVPMGADWVTPEQFAAIKSQSGPAIEKIQTLLANNHAPEAQKALTTALKTWPNNSTLLYLDGVVLYRAKQLVPARQAFEAAAKSDPSNPAIHNNLAVIHWQVHQQAAALLEYERAMAGDVPNKVILDNVASALHGLPPAVASSAIGRRVAARFDVLDTRLSASMARQGLHRYGSDWIEESEYESRMKADVANQAFISSYTINVQSLKSRLQTIDQTIQQDLDTLHTIDQQTNIVTETGAIVQLGHPERYQELSKEVADLNIEKIMKTKELRALPKKLADSQATPGPQWKPTPSLMGEEVFASATTQPATAAQATTQP
jgi:tetratricopeptide (TPR) repeat protein